VSDASPLVRATPAVLRLAQAVREAGGRALVVGGCVRDALLGLPLKDWDIEVHGLDAEALERVLARIGRLNTVGRAFSVYKVRMGRDELDVSIPRRDAKEGPGHRGIRAEADPHLGVVEASRRRDLTLNAMMFDVLDGTLIDPWGGQDDLRRGVLRAVDRDTFLEDPLRALRVVQFAARFGMPPDDALVAMCREAALDELPPERVQGEWVKLLLRGADLALGLRVARDLDLLRRVFPEVAAHDDPAMDARVVGAEAERATFEPEGRRLAWMLLAWLAHLPAAADVEATLERLRIYTWLGYDVRAQVMAAYARQRAPLANESDVRWLATRAEVDLVAHLRALDGDRDAARALAFARASGILHAPPERLVLGRDLIALGARPGRELGERLDAVWRAQLDGAVRTRDEGLAWLSRSG
jgi:tRNA nucleotidyltransferase (CCA-adding enzyme)